MTAPGTPTAVRFAAFGDPADVARTTALDALPPLGPGDVELALVASPIDPADLLLLRGQYAYRPPLPAIGGLEGVARVRRVGEAVLHVQRGDLVQMPLGVGAWQSHLVVDGAPLHALPADADPLQLAMLSVNPVTAHRMLHHTVAVDRGDWVVQNAANSGVGRCVIQLARAAGIRTINVVRRTEVIPELEALGAEHVVMADDDLPTRVAEITGGDAVRLALDAVGGPESRRLLLCLDAGGVLVSYGNMSGQQATFWPSDLAFGRRSIHGFNVGDWLAAAGPEEVAGLYRELLGPVRTGDLVMPVDATYGLDDVTSALRHADGHRRGGKVLLVGPGL
ncbi:MAG: 2-enoyl thioester reductase domain-containing protein [Solirubrobacteraceae bacterium]